MDKQVLHEQVAYYRARAQEYDDTIFETGRFALDEPTDTPEVQEFKDAIQAVRELGPYDTILELACGTGIWTAELAQIGQRVTAIDASPEMLELNQRKVGESRVRYECADLFEWEPEQEYDLVFFAFWLSHVPPERLDAFLGKVRRAVRPGGELYFVDEPATTSSPLAQMVDGIYQTRLIADGREFTIVKVFYDPATLTAKVRQLGFEPVGVSQGDYFFSLRSTRRQ